MARHSFIQMSKLPNVKGRIWAAVIYMSSLSCVPSILLSVAVFPEKASCPIPAACSGVGTHPILRDILSRSWLVALLPMPGYSFSDGHSIFKVLFTDELSQVYTFLITCAVCP